ncbi:hypothetical protein QNI16_14880 [Cytophagaceae bacterium YF14B1]|uniref:Uncharacterized protein n=1 Tax=Xanthocytophaga flava TaxID=3048013 RepID=A0AAE3QQX5_9BACT|nr:hypothetical protein [Xanthocytophaga flavus]MDJ1481783.1 hypothetical protein [Xanthocytophaga flavus]
MNKVFLFVFGLLILISQCSNENKQSIAKKAQSTSFVRKDTAEYLDSSKTDNYPLPKSAPLPVKKKVDVEEHIVDSTQIGERGCFKLDLSQIRNQDDEVFVKFSLYQRTEVGWRLNQKKFIQKSNISNLGLIIYDYNNDGYKDIAYKVDAAARGANDMRIIWLFVPETGKLTPIKNASNFPNLRYNKELDCLDSWAIYGGSSTIFLKIEGDSLREFAGLDSFDGYRTTYTINKSGKKRILKKEKIYEDAVYNRYSNYNPLKEYTSASEGSKE